MVDGLVMVHLCKYFLIVELFCQIMIIVILSNCEKDTDSYSSKSSKYRKIVKKVEKSIFYSSKVPQNIEKSPKRQKSRYFITRRGYH